MTKAQRKVAARTDVLMKASAFEMRSVEHSQIVMGAVDRNEHRSRMRLDNAADELLKAVRAWRLTAYRKSAGRCSNG
jgi:hypothetical protein